jgi:hypothetical protein
MPPPVMLETMKTGELEKPAVNFFKSTCTLVGSLAVFFATVPCGMARNCRYSSSRV